MRTLEREKMRVLAIDFDDTICSSTDKIPGHKMGKPEAGAREAVAYLYDEGFTIIIHTVRAITPEGTKSVKDWLDSFEIPYHEITATKPNAICYLDNKGLKFETWGQALSDIATLTETPKTQDWASFFESLPSSTLTPS